MARVLEPIGPSFGYAGHYRSTSARYPFDSGRLPPTMSSWTEVPPPTVRIQRGISGASDARPASMSRSRSQSMGERSKNHDRQSRPRGTTIVGAGEEELKDRSSWTNFGLPRILPWSKSEGNDLEHASKTPSASENVQLDSLSDSHARSVSSPSDLNRASSSRSDPRSQAPIRQKRGSRVLLLDSRKNSEGPLPPPIVVDLADEVQSEGTSAPAGPSREVYESGNQDEPNIQSQCGNEPQQKGSTITRLGHMIPLHRLGHLWPTSSSGHDDETSRASTRGTGETEEQWEDDGEKPTVRIQESRENENSTQTGPSLHSDAMVDYLDVLDPAVSFFNTLQNYGNSAMLPNIPWLYNRRPMLRMDQLYDENNDNIVSPTSPENPSPLSSISGAAQPSIKDVPPLMVPGAEEDISQASPMDSVLRLDADGQNKSSEDSMEDREYEGETQPWQMDKDEDPHTERWYQMDEEERKELEGHIRHLLTNKSKTKRMARGFWNFVRTPMGFILTLYIFLIFSWGVVIFLFIVHWVDVEPYTTWRVWVEVCDQVLCALFVLRGMGFAPFRAVDTYRMAHIAHFHFLTYKRRKLLHLPKLQNQNELPRYSKERLYRLAGQSSSPPPEEEGPKELDDPSRDLEAIGVRNTDHIRSEGYHLDDLLQPMPGQPGGHQRSREQIQLQRLERAPSIQSMVEKDTREVSVLTPSEQALLQHHQRKFHSSHTFYRYRETSTHQPFPLWLMMTIVILLDIYSCLQACLAGTTWGIRYERRPTVLTATIISFSLSCNAVAGILIWQGGKHTRKTEVVKRRVKLALEQRAIERMERKRKQRTKLDASQLGLEGNLRVEHG